MLTGYVEGVKVTGAGVFEARFALVESLEPMDDLLKGRTFSTGNGISCT